MSGFSLIHWVVLIAYLVVIGVPVAKILGRLGYSKALVIIAFIPLLNLIGLWILAYSRWPSATRTEASDA